MSKVEPIWKIDPAWISSIEDMGSKQKFWFRFNKEKWLFKYARPNTGEHWAEKVASEIAELLKLPTHEVRMAEFEGCMGCAVKSFLKSDEVLVHGNELMAGAIAGYDKDKQRRQSDHHFDNIVATLEHYFQKPKIRSAASSRMIGYLVLDALVGNTDRHHENWGFLVRLDGAPESSSTKLHASMAPTFDHGSSLGRELLEERAQKMLAEPDSVARYVRKAKGGIFKDNSCKKGLAPIALVELIAEVYPELFVRWQWRVNDLPQNFCQPLLDKIPDSEMSATHKQFVLVFLEETRKLIASVPTS